MDDKIKKRAKKVVDAGMNIPLANLTEAIDTNEKLDALLSKDIIIPPIPEEIEITLEGVEYIKGDKGDTSEYPAEVSINNLPEVQKVEVINFPEQKAPVVKVEASKAPVVNVEAPIVNVDTEEVVAELKNISDILSRPEEYKEDVDFQKLFDELGEKIAKLKISGGLAGAGSLVGVESNTKGVAPLSGSSANGTRDLTSANTWYAVPSTVPSAPYTLVVTQENATGTIRWGFDNTGTPSATNGNQAPSQLTVRLSAGQVVYYASSTAGDDVCWTTKII